MATSATPQPPSGCTYDINLKVLHHLVPDLLYSQSWVSMLPPTIPINTD